MWSVALYETSHAERIYVGVHTLNVNVGGLTRAEAHAVLQARLAQLRPTQLVYLRDGAQRYTLTLAELGITLNEDAVLDAAFAIGRGGSWLENLSEQLDALWNGKAVSAALLMDDGVAQVALKRLARQSEREPRDATVTLIGAQVVSTPAVMGRALDVDETIERLKARVLNPKFQIPNSNLQSPSFNFQPSTNFQSIELALAIRELPPVVRDADDAAGQLRAILSAPLRLTFSEQTWTETGKAASGLLLAPIQQERMWTLDTATLATMIGTRQVQGDDGQAKLSVSLDDEKLDAFLQEIAAQIDRRPRDARFYFDQKTQKLLPTVVGQAGYVLDVPATIQSIKNQLTSDQRSVPLVVQVLRPNIAIEDVDKFNIKELVVAGTTSFKGSSPERVKNITIATNQFNGIVIAPGQEFSFNQYLGDVVDALGYEPAYVIIGDRTDVGIGGGVCQVSTTAFRAAFFGGYLITQRWAHGYTVRYYEPPVGLDATVYAPVVDFRFVNDTPNYLLIQPSIDYKNSALTFSFYGTKNNRTVEMDGPTITKVIPHGPDIRENDPTLPAGVVKQVDFAADGKTVIVNRVVKEGDKVLYRDRFVSNYRPWQARFLIGTKKT